VELLFLRKRETDRHQGGTNFGESFTPKQSWDSDLIGEGMAVAHCMGQDNPLYCVVDLQLVGQAREDGATHCGSSESH
jgi:hypothetical protein